MKLYVKILIAVGALILLGLLGIIVYQQFEINKRQTTIEQQVVKQKELSDKLMRSQSEYATRKDIENFVKNNGLSLNEIKKDLGKLNAEVTSANQVIVYSSGIVKDRVASSEVGPANPTPISPICKDGSECQNADPYGYLKNQQKLTLIEPFGQTQVPIGQIGFSAWQDKPWSINVLPREYTINTVVGTDENQRQYFYNKFTVKVDGKNYDLPITQAQTKQVYPESKFSFWNPRLFLGMDGGVNITSFRGDFVPNIGVGFMSYGRYKNVPDFSILQLGLGYGVDSKSIQFVLTPVTYNIGKHIPLMNNTYLGPSLMLSPKGDLLVTVGIRVGL